MQQTVIQIGNSLGITFPAEYAKKIGLQAGKKINVVHDVETKTTIISAGKKIMDTELTPEFKAWLDEISEKEADTIKALAKA